MSLTDSPVTKEMIFAEKETFKVLRQLRKAGATRQEVVRACSLLLQGYKITVRELIYEYYNKYYGEKLVRKKPVVIACKSPDYTK